MACWVRKISLVVTCTISTDKWRVKAHVTPTKLEQSNQAPLPTTQNRRTSPRTPWWAPRRKAVHSMAANPPDHQQGRQVPWSTTSLTASSKILPACCKFQRPNTKSKWTRPSPLSWLRMWDLQTQSTSRSKTNNPPSIICHTKASS